MSEGRECECVKRAFLLEIVQKYQKNNDILAKFVYTF